MTVEMVRWELDDIEGCSRQDQRAQGTVAEQAALCCLPWPGLRGDGEIIIMTIIISIQIKHLIFIKLVFV